MHAPGAQNCPSCDLFRIGGRFGSSLNPLTYCIDIPRTFVYYCFN
jgi:hypothetical protein